MTQQLVGLCPECETSLTTAPLTRGETMSCPECLLTLRVDDINDGKLSLEMIEMKLNDWGE